MASPASIGVLFLALALIFIAAAFRAFRNYLRAEGKPSPARQTWLRVAVIFAIVGIGLQLVHLFLDP